MQKMNISSFPKDSLQVIFDVANQDASPANPAEVFYPGSYFVDWFLITGFNTPSISWSLPAELFSPMVTRLRVLSPTTPLGLSGATSSDPYGVEEKNSWIFSFFEYAVYAQMLYYNVDGNIALGVFGGTTGTNTWTSPATGVTYNVYSAWSTAVNSRSNGIQSSTSTMARLITDKQFMGS